MRQAAMEYGGKIIVFGTPGEENIQTKSLMAPEGAFDEADAAMMVHPNPGKTAVGGKTLAIESLQVEFFGKSSHAGAAPEKGINALDAAVHFYQMVSTRKQYFPGTNVYGIINDGGEKASVIPDYASLKYLTRAWDMETLTNLRTMVEQCAEAAAQMTGCTFEIYNNETTNAAVLSNQKMSEIFERNLAELGVTDITHDDIKGSTDMGDVSQRIPSIHPWVMLPCSSNAVLHSKEFASATMEPAAGEYIMRCAAAMALTGAEILKNEEVFAEIKADFVKSQQ